MRRSNATAWSGAEAAGALTISDAQTDMIDAVCGGCGVLCHGILFWCADLVKGPPRARSDRSAESEAVWKSAAMRVSDSLTAPAMGDVVYPLLLSALSRQSIKADDAIPRGASNPERPVPTPSWACSTTSWVISLPRAGRLNTAHTLAPRSYQSIHRALMGCRLNTRNPGPSSAGDIRSIVWWDP